MSEHKRCHVEPIEKPVDRAALSRAMTAYLVVWGMRCPRCAVRVRNALLGLDGVLVADVFLDEGIAAVSYDPERMNAEDLVVAVAFAGDGERHRYQAEVVDQIPTRDLLGE